MMDFVPILSLKAIVYPTEQINIHLPEGRDTQLVKDCIEKQKPLGIVYAKEHQSDFRNYGTEAVVTELVKTLEDGSLYLRIKGTRVFRLLEVKETIPEKAYSGAIVEYPQQEELTVASKIKELIISEAKRLYELMRLEQRLPTDIRRWCSYDFAHRIGLDQEQEYVLLTFFSEIQRMEYIRRHLNAIMPVVLELEKIKQQVEMNGHFRNLS